MRLKAILTKDRMTGRMYVYDRHGYPLAMFPCLGRADNITASVKGNPARTATKPYGDTPTGSWRVTPGKPQENTATYGAGPVFIMEPLSGEAVQAYRNGRSGIWIHGGALNTAGSLRPTFGCLRLHEGSIQLIRDLSKLYGNPVEVEVTEVETLGEVAAV